MILKSKKIWVLGLLGATLTVTGCSGGASSKQTSTSRTPHPKKSALSQELQPWRPHVENDIPVTMNADVQRWVNLFQGRFKEHFDRWMGRLGNYGPIIETILKEENAPHDLIYLAMIESGFNLKATSSASAVGPWQFIKSTGSMYGLHHDFFMDDRSDLIRATQAAARHLNDLYKMYGDWYLAFAAYNAGPGTVNKAIARTHSKNYWVHARSRHLRQETKDYVPKILAALEIVKNYRKYGYTSQNFGSPMLAERVSVPDATDIGVIAHSANTSVDTIKDMNPALTSGITRPGQQIDVFVPQGSKNTFQSRYFAVPEDERVSGLYYRVGPNDTLASIAKEYALSKSHLANMNNIGVDQKLGTGQIIRIPSDRKVLLAIANPTHQKRGKSGGWTYHTVRRGETLQRIATKYRAKTRDLASWNHLGKKYAVHAGQKLKVSQNGVKQKSEKYGPFYAMNDANLLREYRSNATLATLGRRQSGVSHIIAGESESSQNSLGASATAPMVAADDQNDSSHDTTTQNNGVIENGGTIAEESNDMNQEVAQHVNISTQVAVTDDSNQFDTSFSEQPAIVRTIDEDSSQFPFTPGIDTKGGPINPNSRYVTMKSVAPNKQTAEPKIIVHQTRSGDTLWMISKRYGVKIADIKKWNQLRGDTLKPNQKIRIYAASSRRTTTIKS